MYDENTTFKEFVNDEVLRFAHGANELDEQLRWLFGTEPCLKEALMLSALISSFKQAEQLLEHLRSYDTIENKKKEQCIEEWQNVLVAAQHYFSVHETNCMPPVPDADELLEMGFPMRYVKYVDNWHAAQFEPFRIHKANNYARKAINEYDGPQDVIVSLATRLNGKLEKLLTGEDTLEFAEAWNVIIILKEAQHGGRPE